MARHAAATRSSDTHCGAGLYLRRGFRGYRPYRHWRMRRCIFESALHHKPQRWCQCLPINYMCGTKRRACPVSRVSLVYLRSQSPHKYMIGRRSPLELQRAMCAGSLRSRAYVRWLCKVGWGPPRWRVELPSRHYDHRTPLGSSRQQPPAPLHAKACHLVRVEYFALFTRLHSVAT